MLRLTEEGSARPLFLVERAGDRSAYLCTIHAILVLTFVILAGCSSTPVPDDDEVPGQAPGGGMIEKVNSDAADCRKQTRAMAGRNPSAWYDRAYSDCMAGRGYKPDAGQTK